MCSMKKILTVDDDKDIVAAVEAILEMENYSLVSAFTGNECLEIAIREQPDLILLDYMLPDMSGREIVEKLRSKDETRNMKIVIISAAHGLKQLCKDLPIQGVIEKPFELKLLIKTVKRLTQTKDTSK